MKGKILGTLLLVLAIGLLSVEDASAAVCSPNACTPVCGWVYPSSAGMNLNDDTNDDDNTTMATSVQETTTSGFYNITVFTITPYINSSATINTSQHGLSAIFGDLIDGVYTLDANIYYDNFSDFDGGAGTGGTNNFTQNLTVTMVACGTRQFIVETNSGGTKTVKQLATAEAADKKRTGLTSGFGALVLIVGAYLLIKNKKGK